MRAARNCKAKGGKTTMFAGAGSPEAAEASAGSGGFKRGGRHKRALGGPVPGTKGISRFDKRSRGKRATGGSVTSTAGKQSAAKTGGAGEGKEGDGPKGADDDRPKLDDSTYFHYTQHASGGAVKPWISGAIKHPGSFRAAAQKAGMSTKAFADKHKHSSGAIGRKARLAKTLMGLGS